jgi:outer membrane porin, OprD family
MAGLMGRPLRAALVFSAILCGAGVPSRALAQGATDYPIPGSAKEVFSPIREGFEAPIDPRSMLRGPDPWIDYREERLDAKRQERWPNTAEFFRDTELHANSRTSYLDEDQFGFNEPIAFTTGGWLAYESGFIADVFQLRSVVYTTQPLSENAFGGETDNLSADGDQITTLGQLNGLFKLAGQEITVGRQLVRTPYVNPYDIRMIPLSFEGIVLLPDKEDSRSGLDYMASYLTRYKPWDQDSFISFSEGLGIEGHNEGVLITGASYSGNGWNLGGSNYWIKDALNTAYGEIDYLFPFGGDDGLSLRTGANILDQTTVGADLIPGAPYNTYQASARLVASYQGFVFTGAVSKTGNEASIQKPFGYSTSYTALIVTNFHQAGVDAYLLRLSYDLERLGLNGVRVEAAWGQGSGTPDLANGGFADQEELDLRFVYEPHRGPLEGLRVELEYIDWQVFDDPVLLSDELDQFRAIVNYSVPLL